MNRRFQFTLGAMLRSVTLFCMAALALGTGLPRTNGCGTSAIPAFFAAWSLTAFGIWLLIKDRSLAVWGALLAVFGLLVAASHVVQFVGIP
jgi:hypothetical protein